MPHLEKVDVIVLASNEVSAVALDVEEKYPAEICGFWLEALGNGRADRVLRWGRIWCFGRKVNKKQKGGVKKWNYMKIG